MKKMLLLLLVAICTIGWRSESGMQKLGWANIQPHTIQSQTIPAAREPYRGMSLTEYAELAKTDPDAYRKLIQNHLQDEERSQIDKLMNFFHA